MRPSAALLFIFFAVLASSFACADSPTDGAEQILRAVTTPDDRLRVTPPDFYAPPPEGHLYKLTNFYKGDLTGAGGTVAAISAIRDKKDDLVTEGFLIVAAFDTGHWRLVFKSAIAPTPVLEWVEKKKFLVVFGYANESFMPARLQWNAKTKSYRLKDVGFEVLLPKGAHVLHEGD